MGLFTRPRMEVTVNEENVDVRGLNSRSGLEPVFHVIRRAARSTGQAPWVIVGGPGVDPVQPAQYALNPFRRHDWPPDAALLWGDYVALLFAILLPRGKTLPWRRPNVHVLMRAPVAQHDRAEFEARARDALARCGAWSVNFQWESTADAGVRGNSTAI